MRCKTWGPHSAEL